MKNHFKMTRVLDPNAWDATYFRMMEMMCGTLVLSIVSGTFGDKYPMTESFAYLLSAGIVQVIVALFRGYYFQIKKIDPPFLMLPLMIDFVMFFVTISAVISAAASDVVDSCDSSQIGCGKLYATIVIGALISALNAMSFTHSFKQYKEDCIAQKRSRWMFPFVSKQFCLRCLHVILSAFIISFAASIYKTSVLAETLPMTYLFIITVAAISMGCAILWMVLYDMPHQQAPHPLIEALFNLYMLGLTLTAGTLGATGQLATEFCTRDGQQLFRCGNLHASIVLIFGLMVAHAVSMACACVVAYNKISERYTIDNIFAFQLRLIAAVFGIIAFGAGWGFRDSDLLGFSNTWNLTMAAGYLSFVVGSFMAVYIHLLKLNFSHASVPAILELGMFLLTLIAGVLVLKRDCDEDALDVSCGSIISSGIFNLMSSVVFFVLFEWTTRSWSKLPSNWFPINTNSILRGCQLVCGVILFGTAAGATTDVQSSTLPRDVNLLLGAGVVSVLMTGAWSFRYLLLERAIFHPFLWIALDGALGALLLVVSMVAAAGEVADRCRRKKDPLDHFNCTSFQAAIVFSWFLFSLHVATLVLSLRAGIVNCLQVGKTSTASQPKNELPAVTVSVATTANNVCTNIEKGESNVAVTSSQQVENSPFVDSPASPPDDSIDPQAMNVIEYVNITSPRADGSYVTYVDVGTHGMVTMK